MSMTRNEILIALADGKALEVLKDGTWADVHEPCAPSSFTNMVHWVDSTIMAGNQYRIKRTAREWWMNVYADVPMARAHRSKEDADCRSGPGRSECVHVREVLE